MPRPSERIPKIALVTLLASVAGLSAPQAAEFEFRLAHYLPPAHNHAQNILPAWIETVEQASDGRIDIELFPAGQLLGITEIYDGVRNGVAELGWGLPAVQPGRFQSLTLMEFPFLFDSAVDATQAAMELNAEGVFAEDFDGVRLLYLHTHAPAGIHTRERAVAAPEDFEGMRIRFASATVREMLNALGAEPVGVPAPQVYENLEKGVLDGVAFPYDAMKGLRLGEQVDYHTDVPLYVLPFYMIMNQQAFDSLPPDLQEVMVENSGLEEAIRVATSWDDEEARGRAYVVELGNQIVEPDEEQISSWRETLAPVVDAQIEALEGDGVDARSLYERLSGD